MALKGGLLTFKNVVYYWKQAVMWAHAMLPVVLTS